jgi:dienelactone hydrolase
MICKRLAFVGLLLPILVAAVQTIAAQEVRFPSLDTSGAQVQLRGILHKPSGEGPFPAVVMLSGCYGGFGPEETHQSTWADRLAGWGYVALRLDSFGPRGYPNGICDLQFQSVWDKYSYTRARDAYAARSYLSSLSFVDAENIAVIGWSHGGWSIIRVIDKTLRPKSEKPFNAVVAFYPYCPSPSNPDTPILVLSGEKDDLTASAKAMKAQYEQLNWKTEFSFKVYPNTYHCFDFETLPAGGVEFGRHLEYDPEATSDAIDFTRAFLSKHLGAE